MFSFAKAKGTANIVMDDYVIRMLENKGSDLDSLQMAVEKPLPKQVIENGRIIDELAFFEFMKEAVQEWGIKGCYVRFFVPQSLVIIREIDLPDDVTADKAKSYIHLEIGNTIHFPFKNPIFDMYQTDEEANKVTIIAAPEDELLKYTHTFTDLSLKPTVAELQPLGIYRYFLHKQGTMSPEKVYMIIEYSLSSVTISIFHQNKVEFVRHQPLTTSKDYWQFNEEIASFEFTGDRMRYEGEIEDQLNEIDRLRNFYRFSIHHGEKEVNELLIVGDSPDKAKIAELIKARYNVAVSLLKTDEQVAGERIESSFIPALGLALRGGK